MKKPLALLLAASVAAVAGTGSGYYLRPKSSAPKSAAGSDAAHRPLALTVRPAHLDFGTVWEGEVFSWTLPVENHGSEPVEIASFSSTCDCLAVEPASCVIAPGGSRDVRLNIEPTAHGETTGEVQVRLVANSMDGGRGPAWVIRGRVRRVFSVTRHVYLGRCSYLAQPLPVSRIAMEPAVPLSDITVESSVRGVTAVVHPPSPGTKAYTLVLTPAAGLPVGTLEGSVSLRPVLADSRVLSPRQVAVRGTIAPDLEAVPPAVLVGGRPVGEAIETEVTIRSLTGRPVGAVRATAEGDGLKVEPTGHPDRFRIRQMVVRTGTQRTVVHFTTPEAGSPDLEFPVEYTGVSGE